MPEAPVFTILGSGFGMYGYLPALIECGIRVALPQRYRLVVGGRSELARYVPVVTWCASTEEALARANGAVVALRPSDQADRMAQLAQMPNLRDLILEKPVAPEARLAAQVLDDLELGGKRYRVGYTFRFLPWAERLRIALRSGVESVSLDWTFLAHHYRANLENWKCFDASGGGALRFYGIHLIALLAEIGYHEVSASVVAGPSDGETSAWRATLTGENLPLFYLRVDSRSEETRFRIVAAQSGGGGEVVVDQPDPFSSIEQATVYVRDRRVDLLARLCRSLDEVDAGHAQRQRDIIALWARIEATSRRIPASPL